jgi:ABC-type glycerol-3-phosphate transport system substrate-binding protein
MKYKWIALCLVVAVILLPSMSWAAPAKEEVTLRILALPWPQVPVEQELADKYFTPETGIKVIIEGPPYDFVESKTRELIATQSDAYDIYEYDSQWIGEYVLGGGLEQLDTPEYCGAEDSTLDCNNDFVQGFATYIGRFPTLGDECMTDPEAWKKYADPDSPDYAPLYGLPWTIGSMILAYRTDLFEEAGIVDEEGKAKPPETWDEFLEVARKLTVDLDGDGNIDRYGMGWYASRLSDGITEQWTPFHFALGAEIWDPVTWQAQGIVNSDKAVEACQYFVDFNLKHGVVDPATANWFVNEIMDGAFHDKFAMWFTWVSFAGAADNPELSETAGKWGYSVFPGYKDPETGEINIASTFGAQGIGINAHSKYKKEAWQYLQWLKSYDIEKMMVEDPRAGYASARLDLLEYQEKWPPKKASATSSVKGYARDIWVWPEYAELLDIQQREMNLAYIGLVSCKDALDRIAILQQQVLDTSPNNPTK